MAEVRETWERALTPTGTLYIDDLEEIEELFRFENANVEWALSSRGDRGSTRATAGSLSELIELRNRVPDASGMRLTVDVYSEEHGTALSAQAEVQDSEWREHTLWEVEVSASDAYRDRFYEITTGVDRVFRDASQTTWAREHELISTVFRDWWWGVWGTSAAAWFMCVALWLVSPWIAAAAFGTYAFVVAGGYYLKRRFDANASWEPPPFNLRRRRHEDVNRPLPPPILNREVVLFLITVAGGVIATWIAAALKPWD